MMIVHSGEPRTPEEAQRDKEEYEAVIAQKRKSKKPKKDE